MEVSEGPNGGWVLGAAALYMVEGCSQGLLGANWGDGFNTDALSVAALNRAAPGSDPNPFFRQLLGAPYRYLPPPPLPGPAPAPPRYFRNTSEEASSLGIQSSNCLRLP